MYEAQNPENSESRYRSGERDKAQKSDAKDNFTHLKLVATKRCPPGPEFQYYTGTTENAVPR